MTRPFAFAVTSLAVFALESAAGADSPARNFADSRIILDADRLMPLITYESVTATNPNNSNQSATITGVSTGLLTNGPQLTFYTLPRLGFDVVAGSNVTVGASAWVYTNLSESMTVQLQQGTSHSQDQPKTTYWGVAPRVGYVLPLTDTIALWPRAGIEYHKENTSTVTVQGGGTAGGAQIYQLAVDLDGTFVFTPVDHFGITLTVYGGIPIVGGASGLGVASAAGTGASFDTAELAIGGTVGVLGYL
jgi:hypothetical protein